MIVMAGRQAQPTFPVGPFYVKDLALHGFAIFNASPTSSAAPPTKSTAGWRRRNCTSTSQALPLAETASAHQFLEDNTLRKAGTLTGKVVVTP